MKHLPSWLRPKQFKIILIRRFSSRLSLAEYRSSEPLVKTAQKFLADPEFQPMIEVLRNESPATRVHLQLDPVNRAVVQARIEGYQMALNNLFAMGTQETLTEAPEPSFEQSEEELE